MDILEYDYDLPKDKIAQSFVEPRDHSKLMVVGKEILHKRFFDVIDYFEKDDVLVLNKTKVLANKIEGKKTTGASASFIIERKIYDLYLCRIQGCHPRLGSEFEFNDGMTAKIMRWDKPDKFYVKFSSNVEKYVEKYGKMPLPFYVKKKIENEGRYQTIYSKDGNSLAAPTAGLHFTEELLEKIKNKGVKIAYVKLDISFSTFLRVTNKNIQDKKLHEEYIEIDKENAEIINNRCGRLVVCGTTSFRTLESCTEKGKVVAQKKITDLFIFPGYKFEIIPDMLITNFHLPKSSLLMMVSAYIGREKILDAYMVAIEKNYRFYSLGDAMLLIR